MTEWRWLMVAAGLGILGGLCVILGIVLLIDPRP
jgi:hypothetical protein